MNRQDFVRAVSRRAGIPQWEADELLGHLIGEIAEQIAIGEEVQITGFGKFVPRIKVATIKKNPRTGIPTKIPKRRTVVFLPSVTYKEILNKRRRR